MPYVATCHESASPVPALNWGNQMANALTGDFEAVLVLSGATGGALGMRVPEVS
jgi:hypothetical protein